MGVVYLVFNEGYAATSKPGLNRPDLCTEAIRLARLLVELMPLEPEVLALLASTFLHDGRRATRLTGDGQNRVAEKECSFKRQPLNSLHACTQPSSRLHFQPPPMQQRLRVTTGLHQAFENQVSCRLVSH